MHEPFKDGFSGPPGMNVAERFMREAGGAAVVMWVVPVFLGLMIIGGIALIVSGAANVRRALGSLKWPAVEGVVRGSKVTSRTSKNSDGATSTMHYLELAVDYQVGGRQYTTDQVYYGFANGSGDASEVEVERLRYREGAPVKVYYDPAEPAMGVLRTGFDTGVLTMPIAGLAVMFGGLAFLFMFLAAFKGYRVERLGLASFAMVFAVVGLSMLGAGLIRYWSARASLNWPVTEGTVVFAKGQESRNVSVDEEGDKTFSTTHSAPLAYRYVVDGRTYYSNTRRFGALAGAGEDWAAGILEKYPEGKGVVVRYKPDDPFEAVLEPGVTSEAYWLPGAGLAFLLFGVGAMALARRFSFF